MRILAFGTAEFVHALALGGVAGKVAESGEEVRRWLGEHTGREKVGLLVIEEGLADQAREEVDDAKLDPRFPLILEIPGPRGSAGHRKTPLEMVRAALGISI